VSHILIADDDPTIPRLLAMIFDRMGHRLSVAPTVIEAHQLLTGADPIDLLILDFHLQDGDAIGLLERLSADPAFKEVTILMSSAELSDDHPSREAMLALFPERVRPMVKGWIRKPFAIDALIRVVEELLGIKKPRYQ